jgi:hypothetical protein
MTRGAYITGPILIDTGVEREPLSGHLRECGDVTVVLQSTRIFRLDRARDQRYEHSRFEGRGEAYMLDGTLVDYVAFARKQRGVRR